MNLSRITNQAGRFVADNTPAILTAVGVAGTITTAFLAAKASFRAHEIIDTEIERRNLHRDANEEYTTSLEPKETLKLVWLQYLPPVGTGIMTISAIIFANRIGSRRAAAVAAAYTMLDHTFDEYKTKVIEKIGETKEQAVRDEIAVDRVKRNPPTEANVVVVEEGKQLCHDAFSDRYFFSTMETIRKAENDINKQIMAMDYATLSEFYTNVGLKDTSNAHEFGLNTDKWMSIHFTSVLVEEGPYAGKTALSFAFGVVPVRSPWDFRR